MTINETYSPQYIDRWGRVFVRLGLKDLLGVNFGHFLADPMRYMKRVHAATLVVV